MAARRLARKPGCLAASSTGTGCRCSRCSWYSSSRHWLRPTGRRSTSSRRNRSWWPALCRIRLDALSAVHARRVRGDRDDVRDDQRPVPRRLAVAVSVAPFTWVPGPIWFLIKVTLVFFMFAMVKAMVPRYRYDQLMRLGWKVFLPLSLAMVVLTAAVLQFGKGVL